MFGVQVFGKLADHFAIDMKHVATVGTHDVKVFFAIHIPAVVLIAQQAAGVLIAARGLLAAERFQEPVGRGQPHAHAFGLHRPRQFLGGKTLHGVFSQKARHFPFLTGLVFAAHQ